MMKKLVIVVALVAIVGAGTAFGFGIGVHGGFGFGNMDRSGGGGLNLVFSNVYIYIDALAAGEGGMHISGAVDFLNLFDVALVPAIGFGFYIRGGIGLSMWGWDDEFGLAAAARLPLGFSLRPISLIELFLQFVPQIGARFAPDVGVFYNMGGNLGIRFRF